MAEQHVGEFEVVRTLGQGGMGAVYEVRRAGDPRRLALKRIHVTNERTTERFRREGELAARLDHPNIVAVRGAGLLPDGSPYLLFDLIEGRSLHTLMHDEGPQPEERVLELAKQVAAGLAHAHQRGVVHRDIKPANVLLTEEGRVVLADFGLAVAEDMERMTRTGQLIGTPMYFAPEQIQEPSRIGAATDVHAVGILLYELVTGTPPFIGTESGLFDAILRHAPSSVRAERPEVSRGLSDVIATCLQKDPEDRYADGLALGEALEQVGRRGVPRPSLLATIAAPLVLTAIAVGLAFTSRSVPEARPPIEAPSAAASPAPERPTEPTPTATSTARPFFARWRPPLGTREDCLMNWNDRTQAAEYQLGWRATYEVTEVSEGKLELRVTIRRVQGRVKSRMVQLEVDSDLPAPKVLQGMQPLRALVGRTYEVVIERRRATVRGASEALRAVTAITGDGLVSTTALPGFFSDRGLSMFYSGLVSHMPKRPLRAQDRWRTSVFLEAQEDLVGRGVRARVNLEGQLMSVVDGAATYRMRSFGSPLWKSTSPQLTTEMRKRYVVEVEAEWLEDRPRRVAITCELGPEDNPADRSVLSLIHLPQ